MIQIIKASEKMRAALHSEAIDAFRLADGEGDRLPGIEIDSFAGRILISTTSHKLPPALGEWARSSERTVYWKRLDQHEKDSPTLLAGPVQNEPFTILERGVRYQVSFQAGYSQGIFLDQRDNRSRVRKLCQPDDKILNTFAYTGAFSVSAALGGAVTTTLDLSQPYLDWARENFLLNKLDPASQHFCRGDTFHWLERFAKQGRKFEGIILDPPTFSRDPKGKVFRAEHDYGHLIDLASACLASGGWLLCTTNCRRLTLSSFEHTVRNALFNRGQFETLPMPPDFTGEPYLKSLLVTT